MISDAVISDDGRYRYTLTRIWNEGTLNFAPVEVPAPRKIIAFCGLNPSVADKYTNDHTILKEIGFGQRWDYDGLIKVNLYPWRDTDPAKLIAAWRVQEGPSVTGEWGILQLVKAILDAGAKVCVCAWGTQNDDDFNFYLQERGKTFAEMAAKSGLQIQCLGKNRDGSPRHTARLAFNTQLEAWP